MADAEVKYRKSALYTNECASQVFPTELYQLYRKLTVMSHIQHWENSELAEPAGLEWEAVDGSCRPGLALLCVCPAGLQHPEWEASSQWAADLLAGALPW